MSIAPLSRSMRLQVAFATFISAVGTNVMGRLAPIIVRSEREYKSAPSGRKRLVSALKFKATINCYHLAFKVTKSVQKIQLRLLRVDEVLLEFEREFAHLGSRHSGLVAPIVRKLPDLLNDAEAAADKFEARLSISKKLVKIHWKNPRLDADRLTKGLENVESFVIDEDRP
jgi:hypothetical protein